VLLIEGRGGGLVGWGGRGRKALIRVIPLKIQKLTWPRFRRALVCTQNFWRLASFAKERRQGERKSLGVYLDKYELKGKNARN